MKEDANVFMTTPVILHGAAIFVQAHPRGAFYIQAPPFVDREPHRALFCYHGNLRFIGHVLFVQALSKRIHYGKFVAEAKFRARPQEYARLIRQRDTDGLMALLTDEAVEAKVQPPLNT
jgi:hypothetical protein